MNEFRRLAVIVTLLLLTFTARHAGAATAEPIPSGDDIAGLLRREPIALENWPAWRQRLLEWMAAPGRQADAAFEAAIEFIHSQADANGDLPTALESDFLAWYLLGDGYLRKSGVSEVWKSAEKAERAYRRSVDLEPGFARGHRDLALALMIQAGAGDLPVPKAVEAKHELARARELDPSLKLKSISARAALYRSDYAHAERLYSQALAEDPETSDNAIGLAASILQNQQHAGPRAKKIEQLVQRYPHDGSLASLYGLALAMDGDPRASLIQFARARKLGVEPAQMFAPELIAQIEAAARPGLLETFGWTMLAFAAVYALVISGMAAAGFVLGAWTRGAGALRLLADQPLEIVPGGQVVRSHGEPWLARWYAIGLVLGLVLFYVSLPFIAAGLLAITFALLWLIFQAGRIPIKLVVIILVVGLGMAWAVLKSMFARMGSGAFGLRKSNQDCPRLFEALQEVARRVDTSPVDEVYVAPGSEIGVFQEGRGPWGMFGTKKRVLVLGLSTLRTLTIPELKSILAHEYAHFSHQDTVYSRFIHRVDLSIHTALNGMGAAGGKLNYVNPFFWFLVLYYRAYSLLSAGFSRSREYLADRMACSLYGSNVFKSALTKVSTDGPLFESTMYQSVARLLSEQKAFENMYESFASFRQEDASAEHREKIRRDLENERPSRFASHPTHRERFEAVAGFPAGREDDTTPAIRLFEDPEALEKELTEFLTWSIHFAREQGQAAQAAAQG